MNALASGFRRRSIGSKSGKMPGTMSGKMPGTMSPAVPVHLPWRVVFAAVVCLLAVFPVCGFGLPVSPSDDASAQPDRTEKREESRAIRLSSAEGQVQVVQDGEVIADPAFANLPLFEGSQISTGNDGRAEVELEDGSIVRLSPNTTLTFSVLQQQGTATRTEVVLNGGLAYFEVQPSTAEHSLRVNYGDTSFTAMAFSVVRITEDAPPGDLAVLSGNIHVERGVGQSSPLQLDIHGGESLTLDATDLGKYDIVESVQQDSWDNWNADRDQLLNGESADKTAATASLGNSMGVGMSDLDANGSWYSVPGQGYVWSPYDAQANGASWDPYGYGHWVYYPRWGYVWVSGYGWGYAPFQCGRWDYFDSFGWGWLPGSGCSPWWGFGGGDGGYYGGGGWVYRIGNGPPGYHPPRRPFPGPVHPRPGPKGPHQGPGMAPRSGAHPVVSGLTHSGPVLAPVAVDTRPPGAVTSPSLLRAGGRVAGPAMIAGQTVEPLRPIAPRQAYAHPENTFVNRAAPPPAGYGRPGGVGGQQRPGMGYSGARPSSGQGSRPSAPVSRPSSGGGHPSGGGSAPHSAPAAPHK